jgi:hypothetical protein
MFRPVAKGVFSILALAVRSDCLAPRNTRRNTNDVAFPNRGIRPDGHGPGQRLLVLERLLQA